MHTLHTQGEEAGIIACICMDSAKNNELFKKPV